MSRRPVGPCPKERDPGEEYEEENRHGREPALQVSRALDLSVQKKCSLFHALQLPEFLELTSAKTRAAIREFVALLDGYETRILEPQADCAAAVATRQVKRPAPVRGRTGVSRLARFDRNRPPLQ